MLFGKASNMQANIKREGLEDLRFTLSLKCRARHRVSIVSIVRGNIFISEKKLMSNSAKHSLPGETASSGTHGFQQVCTFRMYEIHVFLVWCAFLLKQVHFASSFFTIRCSHSRWQLFTWPLPLRAHLNSLFFGSTRVLPCLARSVNCCNGFANSKCIITLCRLIQQTMQTVLVSDTENW